MKLVGSQTSKLLLGVTLATVFGTVGAGAATTQKAAAKSNKPTSETLKVDTKASVINWDAKKIAGGHHGKIQIKDGTLEVRDHKLSGGTFAVDMATITNEDLDNAEYRQKLLDHLKSDDFFSVANNATSTLVIKSVTPIAGAKEGAPNVEVEGDLTIKGVTNPTKFPATVKVSDAQTTAKAQIKVDRTAYGIKFRSGKFFPDIGDKLIEDQFTLNVDVVAHK